MLRTQLFINSKLYFLMMFCWWFPVRREDRNCKHLIITFVRDAFLPAVLKTQSLGNLVYSLYTNCGVLLSCLSSRVVYVFGPPVKEPPTDVTPTFLTTGVLSTLRQADFEAHNILRESGRCFALSHN